MHPALDALLKVTRIKREVDEGPQLTREQALSACPVRNPNLEWEVNEQDEVVVKIPRRGDNVGRFLGWMFFVPESRPIVLDEVGSFVWNYCDGSRSVADLVDLMAAEYQVGKREMELSLTEYLKTLGKRGMVGLLVNREIAEQAGLKGKQIIGLSDADAADAMAKDPGPPPADPDGDGAK